MELSMATNTQDSAIAFAPATPDMGAEKWIDVGSIRTRYFEAGRGERIAFFHGGNMGSNDDAVTAQCWDINFTALAQHHHVFAIDKLGQGYTDNPKSDKDYTMHATVQHAAATLDALGQGPYHIVGHSRGGYLVVRLALERPDLVKTCICVSSGTLSPGTPRNRLVFADAPVPKLTRQSLRWIYERYSYDPKIIKEYLVDDGVAVSQTEKRRTAVRKMNQDGLLQKLFFPELARQRAETYRWLLERGMPCPTLIIWGFNDPTADFENGKRLIEMFMHKQPKTEIRILNRAGHFVYREQPAAFNRAVHSFVNANSRTNVHQ
jgi:pimeloyl-ACP methyl ester carboxylesterase